MHRILLILEATQNLRFLKQLLINEGYEVLSYENEESLKLDFDLCIVDGFAIKKIKKQVQQLRRELEPVFLPFVLLTSEQRVSLLSDSLQITVDEVILTPIKKKELLVRIKSLLRSRSLSIDIEAKNRKLKELTVIKNRFFSIAAHDLRNPLGVISGSAQMLETYSESLTPEKKQEILERMKKAVTNMTLLLEDTLIMTKAEEGRLELNLSLVNLDELCENLAREFELIYRERQINLIKNYSLPESSEGKKLIPMDGKLLRHIFGNLLSNALKYSTQKAPVKLEFNCQSDRVTFIVEDKGIGIPESNLATLFEPFSRASNVGAISGSGLGLSIVKQCVDLFGGTIEVESEVGVGTTFTVQLPIANC